MRAIALFLFGLASLYLAAKSTFIIISVVSIGIGAGAIFFAARDFFKPKQKTKHNTFQTPATLIQNRFSEQEKFIQKIRQVVFGNDFNTEEAKNLLDTELVEKIAKIYLIMTTYDREYKEGDFLLTKRQLDAAINNLKTLHEVDPELNAALLNMRLIMSSFLKHFKNEERYDRQVKFIEVFKSFFYSLSYGIFDDERRLAMNNFKTGVQALEELFTADAMLQSNEEARRVAEEIEKNKQRIKKHINSISMAVKSSNTWAEEKFDEFLKLTSEKATEFSQVLSFLAEEDNLNLLGEGQRRPRLFGPKLKECFEQDMNLDQAKDWMVALRSQVKNTAKLK